MNNRFIFLIARPDSLTPMSRSVYIASPEGESGKSTVALGLLYLLSRQVGRVGIFRPVTESSDHTDRVVELLIAQPVVEQDVRGCRRGQLPRHARRSRGGAVGDRSPVPRARQPVRRVAGARQRLHRRVHPDRTGLQREGGGQPRIAGGAGGPRPRSGAGTGPDGRRVRHDRAGRRARPSGGPDRQPGHPRGSGGGPRRTRSWAGPAGGGDPRGAVAVRADRCARCSRPATVAWSAAIRSGWSGRRWVSWWPRCRCRTC